MKRPTAGLDRLGLEPERLVEFVAVVDAGSISGAARGLRIPRATLSRRIKALEEQLGVRLMHRETRRLVLTEVGERLVGRARGLVESLDEIWESVARIDDRPRGRLRVATPPTALFEELLFGFITAYPEVELQVLGTPRHADLVGEQIDVAIRFGSRFPSELVMRRLWEHPARLVAHRDYLDRRGRPQTPQQLVGHDFVVGFEQSGQPQCRVPLQEPPGFCEVECRYAFAELPMRFRAVMQGLGMALMPDPVTKPLRDDGTLEWVMPEVVHATASAALVYPDRTFLPPQVRAFIDHTVEFYSDPAHLPAVPT